METDPDQSTETPDSGGVEETQSAVSRDGTASPDSIGSGDSEGGQERKEGGDEVSDDKPTMLVLDRIPLPLVIEGFDTTLKRIERKIMREICMSCETDFQDPDRSRFYTGYGAYCDCCYESFLRSK